MYKNPYLEASLFLVITILNHGSPSNMRSYRFSALVVEEWGHGINDCIELSSAEKNKVRDDPPFSVALKAE